MKKISTYKKLVSLPPALKKEVDDFIDFLMAKKKNKESGKREAGLAKGLIKMKEDFDEPLEDFKDYML